MKKNLKSWLALLIAVSLIVTSGAFANLTYLRATDSETPVETQNEDEASAEEKEKDKEQELVIESKQEEPASVEEATQEESAAESAENISEEGTSEDSQTEDATANENANETNDTLNNTDNNETTNAVAYPAFSYSGSADGVTANITAPEGIFPEGTQVELKALSASDREAIAKAAGCDTSEVVGLDITFKYEGTEIEPNGNVQVFFSSDKIAKEDDVNVYHVNDSGSVDKVGASKDGANVGFTADSFSPYGIAPKGNNSGTSSVNNGDSANNASTASNDSGTTSYTVSVGGTVTLNGTTNNCPGYRVWNWGGPSTEYHSESWTSNDTSIATVSGGTVTGVSAGTVTITHKYCVSENYHTSSSQKTETFTVTVQAVAPTAVSLSGADTVAAFDSISLTANFTPANASADLTWTSSDESILTVDSTGKVIGKSEGSATVTVYAQGTDGQTLSASKDIVVTAATTTTGEALFYYLLDPTKDANSNDTGNWGPSLGTGTVNMGNAIWTNNKNCFDNPSGRVISWPSGYENGVIDKTSSTGTTIFNNYKASLKEKFGVEITIDDVVEIRLVPAKISRNNSSTPDYHVDCNVAITCKDVYQVKYFVQDTSDSTFVQKEAYYYKGDGNTTQPTGDYPTEKTVGGVTYTFSGWYTSDSLQGEAVDFTNGQAVTRNQNYYAKYSKGHYVNYDLNGGTWTSNTNRYLKAEGDKVYVVNTIPTKTGYTFAGWTYSVDNTTMQGGSSFTMPSSDVTLTAQWTPNETTYTVNYYWNGTAETVTTSKRVDAYHVDDTVTESPVEVSGYTAVSTDAESLTLGSDTSTNVINFYYYKNVNLKANSDTRTYNGKDQSVSGFTGAPEKADFSDIAVSATGKDAGTYNAAFAEGTVGTVDSTKKYIVASATDGVLTITPATLTVKTPDANKTYDGTALTAAGTIIGFVNGEEATFTTTGTQTAVGSSDNTYNITWDKTAKANNYTVSATVGKLTVTETTAVITVTTTGGTFTYDGQAHGATVKVEGVPTGYSVETAASNATATDVTTEAVAATCDTLVIKNAQGEDVTSKLKDNIKYVDGSITITPATLTVTTPSESKVYDGEALTAAGEITGFVNGETATFTTTGTQTEVGSSENTYSIAWDGTAKESNYTVNATVGTLTVTENANEIVVTTTGGEFTYDGQAHGATVSVSTLPKGYTLKSATSSATATDVTTKDVVAECDNLVIVNAKGEDVTGKLTIKYNNGSIKINPAALTVTTSDANKAYDGTALTAAGTISGFVNGETASFATTGSQTNVGSSKNTYSLTWDGTAKESNYTVSETVGTLTVTKGKISDYVTLKGNDQSKTYDGTALSAGAATATDKNGNDLKIEYSTDGTNWTEDPSTITATNVSDTTTVQIRVSADNYDGYVTGTETLTITPATVILTSESGEKTYDGTALTKPDVTVSGVGFVEGEVSDIKATGSVTYVEEGKVTNAITYTTGANFKESNYTITKKEGALSINPISTPIVIKANSGEKVYDGSELTAQGVTFTDGVLLEGDELKVTVSGSQTNVGSSDNKVTNIKVMRGEQDVTENYTFGDSIYGTLTVTQRTITLTSGSATKVYDGQPLTKNEVTVTEGSFVEGEGVNYNVTGSQTYAGNSENVFTYTAQEGTDLNNYNVTTKYGTLTVKQSEDEIVITAPSADKMYDGSALTTEGLTATYSGKLVEGDKLMVTLSGSQTDAGESATTVSEYKVIRTVDGKETDVTSSYKFGASVSGTLTVTKRNVTLTSATDSKTYDGTALTNHNVEVTGDGFTGGEGVEAYDFSGSQLDAGFSSNSFSYTLKDNTSEANYNIKVAFGILTVTPISGDKTITITANSNSKTYDGTALTDSSYSYTKNILVKGDVLTAVVEGSVTNVDDVNTANVVTSYKVMRGDTDVTKNYTITTETGSLTINPRTVTLTSADDSKPYDGKPLKNETITVGGEGFVAGEGASYNVTGSQILVGSSENTFIYTLNEDTKEANYTITTANGTLKVTDNIVDPETVVTKTHADKADGGRYDLGEVVTFTINVTNPYDTAKTITLTEQGGVVLAQNVFENVAPGAQVSTMATYTIKESDVRKGEYNNKVTAAFSDGGKKFTGEDTVEVENGKAHLTVIKTAVTSEPEGGFKLGDKITYSITVKNDGNLTVNNIEVTDDKTGDVLVFGTLEGHQEAIQTVEYTVTEDDVLAGTIVNNATVTKAEDPDGKTPDTTPGTATVTTEEAKPSLVVHKTVNGRTSGYKLGEEIIYSISVENTGNVTVKNVVVSDELTGDKLTFGDITPGETAESQQVTYKVTEDDVLQGSIVNVATATGSTPKGADDPTVTPGTTTVTTEDPSPSMTVNKKTTSEKPEGGYKVGDVITYAISVTNTGNVTLSNVKVSDALTGNVDSDVLDFGTITPGETSKEQTVSYTVTEADVSRGYVRNEATGTATDPKNNDPDVTPGTRTDETVSKNSHVTVVKETTSTMPEGGYKLNDTIEYKITVTNDGNQTLTNVNITDDLNGLVKNNESEWSNITLGIGESKTVTATYVVTEADIRNGHVLNNATVTGAKDPDGEDPSVTPGTTDDTTETKNSHVTVTKKTVSTSDDAAGYKLGEEITYEITVTNDGNQTLTDVVIEDSLEGVVKVNPDEWTIAELKVGESKTVTATYTVTEADIRNGKVNNVATISSMNDPDGLVNPDPENPDDPKPVTPGTDEQPTEKEESSLFITKTADKTSELRAGDVVTYTISVVNNGNQTIKDIVVKDELTGDSFDGKILGFGGITLRPGESKNFTVEYTITEADVISGSVKNVATVTGTDPSGKDVDSETEKDVDTEKANANYQLDKTVDEPKSEYKVGDVVNYTITVTNTGNLTLNNLEVTDQMQGASGSAAIAEKDGVTVDGNKAVIAKLAVGESIELKASYTVAREDADSTLSNKVNVTTTSKPGTDPDGEDPNTPVVPDKEKETETTDVEKTYLLTIHYVDGNGNIVAPDYTVRLLAGDTVDAIVSPTIDGYTPDYGSVSLPSSGMPANDVTVTVVYTANPVPVVIPDTPNTPDDGGNNDTPADDSSNGTVPTDNTGEEVSPAETEDGVIETTDDGGYDVTPIDKGETPLANINLDDHACCILHFLIMLLTLIIFALYTKSRKNRQMKVEELREQYAIAFIQKELDLSDEDMAKYLEEAKKRVEDKKRAEKEKKANA